MSLPAYEFVITEERWEKTQKLFALTRELGMTDDQMLDVVAELRLQDSLTYSEDGQAQFTMTGVQFVALTYAMSAVREGGCQQRLRSLEGAEPDQSIPPGTAVPPAEEEDVPLVE